MIAPTNNIYPNILPSAPQSSAPELSEVGSPPTKSAEAMTTSWQFRSFDLKPACYQTRKIVKTAGKFFFGLALHFALTTTYAAFYFTATPDVVIKVVTGLAFATVSLLGVAITCAVKKEFLNDPAYLNETARSTWESIKDKKYSYQSIQSIFPASIRDHLTTADYNNLLHQDALQLSYHSFIKKHGKEVLDILDDTNKNAIAQSLYTDIVGLNELDKIEWTKIGLIKNRFVGQVLQKDIGLLVDGHITFDVFNERNTGYFDHCSAVDKGKIVGAIYNEVLSSGKSIVDTQKSYAPHLAALHYDTEQLYAQIFLNDRVKLAQNTMTYSTFKQRCGDFSRLQIEGQTTQENVVRTALLSEMESRLPEGYLALKKTFGEDLTLLGMSEQEIISRLRTHYKQKLVKGIYSWTQLVSLNSEYLKNLVEGDTVLRIVLKNLYLHKPTISDFDAFSNLLEISCEEVAAVIYKEAESKTLHEFRETYGLAILQDSRFVTSDTKTILRSLFFNSLVAHPIPLTTSEWSFLEFNQVDVLETRWKNKMVRDIYLTDRVDLERHINEPIFRWPDRLELEMNGLSLETILANYPLTLLNKGSTTAIKSCFQKAVADFYLRHLEIILENKPHAVVNKMIDAGLAVAPEIKQAFLFATTKLEQAQRQLKQKQDLCSREKQCSIVNLETKRRAILDPIERMVSSLTHQKELLAKEISLAHSEIKVLKSKLANRDSSLITLSKNMKASLEAELAFLGKPTSVHEQEKQELMQKKMRLEKEHSQKASQNVTGLLSALASNKCSPDLEEVNKRLKQNIDYTANKKVRLLKDIQHCENEINTINNNILDYGINKKSLALTESRLAENERLLSKKDNELIAALMNQNSTRAKADIEVERKKIIVEKQVDQFLADATTVFAEAKRNIEAELRKNLTWFIT